MNQQPFNFVPTPINDAARQTALYQGIWAADENYGTKYADVFDTVQHRILPHISRLAREHGTTVTSMIDFGAGDGRMLAMLESVMEPRLARYVGLDVYKPKTYIDWLQQVMWEPVVEKFHYVISTDALEHLPPAKVSATLENIARCAPHGFLRISLIEDRYGTERGLHLHESVFSSKHWLDECRVNGIKVTGYKVYLSNNIEHALEVWF